MEKRYYLKSPKGKAKSFSIYIRTVRLDGSTNNETISNPDIAALNHKYQSGEYSLKEAKRHAESIRFRLNVDLGVEEVEEQINFYNQKLLKKYWENEYSFRDIRDEHGAKNKLQRALRALGDLSIATASRGELQNKIKNLDASIAKRREVSISLNQLLKYAKRDFKLIMPRKQIKNLPDHLTPDEFNRVVAALPDEALKVAAWIAYSTGVRLGELLALDSSSYIPAEQMVYVRGQLDKAEELVPTKTGRMRHAFIYEFGIEYIKIWDLHRQHCIDIGHNYMSKLFKKTCQKLFPNTPEKHCTFHDLRHSYAINLVPAAGFDLASQSLGHAVGVCQEYYGGLALSKQGIAAIKMKVDQAKKEKL